MPARRQLVATVLWFVACVGVAPAELITINVDKANTTANHTLFGTTISGDVATWPAPGTNQYRDYQFELLTPSGTTTFDQFAVQFSGQLRNQTPANNLLRATLWSGPIVSNPLLASQLVTVSVPNSAMTSSGWASVLLTGSSFTPQAISTTPSTFFFRVWAEGSGQNFGYQTKMAASLADYQAVTMTPSAAIDAYIEYDTNGDGTISSGEELSTRDLISEVPEPAPLALAALGLVGSWAWSRGRRAGG